MAFCVRLALDELKRKAHWMADIQPILLSAITCGRVIFDKVSGMPSVIDIVQTIDAHKYPARHSQIVFFCDFATLASQLSQDPGSASQGGDLGWQEHDSLVKPFADAAWSLKPGEISPPVETDFGWHVIKLEAIEPGTTRSFEEVRAELSPCH